VGVRLLSAPPMNANVHAAIESRRAQYRAAGELLMTTAACAFLWGWPEIIFPAQAKAGLAFGLAMGVPTGTALFLTYWLFDALFSRMGRQRESPDGMRDQAAGSVEAEKRRDMPRLRVGA
jgi:hypothetical protein